MSPADHEPPQGGDVARILAGFALAVVTAFVALDPVLAAELVADGTAAYGLGPTLLGLTAALSLPTFVLALAVSRARRTRSIVFFAVAGAVASWPITLALLVLEADLHSLIPRCAAAGAAGGGGLLGGRGSALIRTQRAEVTGTWTRGAAGRSR